MARQDRIGAHKTSVFTDTDGMTKVVYHHTTVVSFDAKRIVLNSGGYTANTTKTRMNQASNQFALGFRVYQRSYGWYIEYKGMTQEFHDKIELSR